MKNMITCLPLFVGHFESMFLLPVTWQCSLFRIPSDIVQVNKDFTEFQKLLQGQNKLLSGNNWKQAGAATDFSAKVKLCME